MLEHARRNAAKAGLQNIEFIESPAEDLQESLIPFDGSISRLGLMLFPFPRNALRAVLCLLKPDARFSALVFTTPNNNPFMAQPMAILLRNAGKSAPAPGQPGIFALGGDGILENLMKESGFTDVKSTKVRASLKLASVFHLTHDSQMAANQPVCGHEAKRHLHLREPGEPGAAPGDHRGSQQQNQDGLARADRACNG